MVTLQLEFVGDLGDTYVANKPLKYRYEKTWTYQGFHFPHKKKCC